MYEDVYSKLLQTQGKRAINIKVLRTQQPQEFTGTLSKGVPSSAIRMANNEAIKLGGISSATASKHSGKPRPNGYLMLPLTQRCEIGKQAAAHGVTASLKYGAEKYPCLRLTETSVRRFKNLCKEAVEKKLDEVKKRSSFQYQRCN